jgi:multidrug efflux system outer membrane protein
LEVLDAQRSLFNAEIEDATTASEHARSLIQLYKALGAGWPVPKKDKDKDKGAASSAPPPEPTPAAPEPKTPG